MNRQLLVGWFEIELELGQVVQTPARLYSLLIVVVAFSAFVANVDLIVIQQDRGAACGAADPLAALVLSIEVRAIYLDPGLRRSDREGRLRVSNGYQAG